MSVVEVSSELPLCSPWQFQGTIISRQLRQVCWAFLELTYIQWYSEMSAFTVSVAERNHTFLEDTYSLSTSNYYLYVGLRIFTRNMASLHLRARGSKIAIIAICRKKYKIILLNTVEICLNPNPKMSFSLVNWSSSRSTNYDRQSAIAIAIEKKTFVFSICLASFLWTEDLAPPVLVLQTTSYKEKTVIWTNLRNISWERYDAYACMHSSKCRRPLATILLERQMDHDV